MKLDCLLSGVGGQGIVLASRIIAQAAMEKGLFARTSETIGMAQRGGCVVSHVRIGDTVSPLIPLGGADLLIGFEPGEALRCIAYLKEGGAVIVSAKAIQPVTAALAGKSFDASPYLEGLQRQAGCVIVVDGDAVCKACGSDKVLNTALLGAAAASGRLGLSLAEITAVLRAKLPPPMVLINEKALQLGAAAAKGE
ncbi:MAG TPA: indolepyruvate oxidoreductase subunit beta [Clostridiales bacterium]|nr:indolepyruvate oxidoreductase subunit beta [Clostridiales bacterium]